MRTANLRKVRHKLDEFENRARARSESLDHERVLALVRKLTSEERRWLLYEFDKNCVQTFVDLSNSNLDTDERTELQRLGSIMSDPDALDGSLRDEWVRTRRFLDDLDWTSNPVAPIIRRGIELFVERRSGSVLPEDVELVARCREFLHGTG
jgi:hypothetical protein